MRRGFTLIELLVVLAVLALLTSLALPRYFTYVDRSREAVLKHNLNTMRERIDQFRADKGRFPDSLAELVEANYLRTVPVDPITERSDTWKLVVPRHGQAGTGIEDVRSGASGAGLDGVPYASM